MIQKKNQLQVSDLREQYYKLNNPQQENNQNMKNAQNESVVDAENGQNGKEYILKFNPLDINRLKLEIENISYRLKLRESRNLNKDRSFYKLQQQKVRLQEYLDKLIDKTQKLQIQIGNNVFILEKIDGYKKLSKVEYPYYSFSEQFEFQIKTFSTCKLILNICLSIFLILPLFLLVLIAYLSHKFFNFLSNQELQDIFQCTKVDITVQRYTYTLVEQDQFIIDDGTSDLEYLLSKKESKPFNDNQHDISKLERIKLFLLNPTEKNFRNIEEQQKCNFSKINIQGLLIANILILLITLTFIYQSLIITQLSNEEYVQNQKYIDIPFIVCFIVIQIYEFSISHKIKRFLRDPITISTWFSFFQSFIERYQLYVTFKFSLTLIVYDILESQDLGIASMVFFCLVSMFQLFDGQELKDNKNFSIIHKYALQTGFLGLNGLNKILSRYSLYKLKTKINSLNFFFKTIPQFIIFIIFSLRQRESGNYESSEFIFLSFKILTTISFIMGLSQIYSRRENIFAHHQFLEYLQNNVYKSYLKQRQQYDLNEIYKIIKEYYSNHKNDLITDEKQFKINLLQHLVQKNDQRC